MNAWCHKFGEGIFYYALQVASGRLLGAWCALIYHESTSRLIYWHPYTLYDGYTSATSKYPLPVYWPHMRRSRVLVL